MRLIHLLESANGYEQYADIWTTAVTFLEEKSRALMSLPETSPEKLLAQALLGAFYKYKPEQEGDAVSQIKALVGELAPMVRTNDGELATYIHGTVEGLQRLSTQIPASADLDLGGDAPEGDGEGESGEPDESEGLSLDKPKPRKEEPEPSEKDQLANDLGLRDSHRPLRLSKLLEQLDYQPGQSVTIIRDGKVLRRQILKRQDRRITLVDPENPSDNVEVDEGELGVDKNQGPDQDRDQNASQDRFKPLQPLK